jgi:hypothetical protein
MNRDDDISVRRFFGWLAMILGALLGLAIIDLRWQIAHPGINMRGLPTRDLTYWLLALLCMVSGGIVGLALARFRDLPSGEEKETSYEDRASHL